MSDHVGPGSPAVTEIADVGLAHSEADSDGATRLDVPRAGADGADLIGGQLLTAVPSTSHHVEHVVDGATEQEMSRIAAPTVVAGMTDNEFFGDRTDFVQPDQSVGVLDATSTTTYRQPSMVGAWMTATSPRPAVVRSLDFDLRQQTIDDGGGEWWVQCS